MSSYPTGPGLVTPDAVALDLETATVGSRAVAALLDLLLLGSGYLLLGLASAILGGGGFVPGWVGIALLLVLVFALQFGYPIGFETLWRGRTPGKAAMGLRVITLEGAPVGLRHAAVRATVGLFELYLLLGLPAVVTSLVSARGQRLGDLAAGTLVVRERRATAALAVESFQPPAGLEAYTARLDISALGPGEYATIRDTLRRLPSLPDEETRTRIAEQVATPLAARVRPGPPEGIAAATWLRCLAAAVQARRHRADAWGSGVTAPPVDHRPQTTAGSGAGPAAAELTTQADVPPPTSTERPATRSERPPATSTERPATTSTERPSGGGFVPPS